MVFFLNTKFSGKKLLYKDLTNIFGLGNQRTVKILKMFGISKKASLSNISIKLRNKIINYIEKNFEINEFLKQKISQIRENHKTLKTYRGQRMRFNLPCRGQRTHTNAKTVKKARYVYKKKKKKSFLQKGKKKGKQKRK